VLLLGVILSTAFVHLLQDAFEALLDPEVKRMSGVGEWAGLLVYDSISLCSENVHSPRRFVQTGILDFHLPRRM
jgi:hypothetical protein